MNHFSNDNQPASSLPQYIQEKVFDAAVIVSHFVGGVALFLSVGALMMGQWVLLGVMLFLTAVFKLFAYALHVRAEVVKVEVVEAPRVVEPEVSDDRVFTGHVFEARRANEPKRIENGNIWYH